MRHFTHVGGIDLHWVEEGRGRPIVLLQSSGKDLADCEGECEVDTGRRIGADAVISGDVLKFGERYKLSLRLHETKGGRLLSAAVASGATLEELDAQVQQKALELIEGQR